MLFSFFDDFCCTTLSVNDTLLCFFVRLGEFDLHALFGDCQLVLATFGSSKAFRYTFRTIVECLHQWRPHEFHREHREDEEDDELRKQSCVQVHGYFLLK